MNLLITGATGYIGKNLISELKKNKKNSFLIPFRDKYKLDKDLIKNKNQFKLVHLSKKTLTRLLIARLQQGGVILLILKILI